MISLRSWRADPRVIRATSAVVRLWTEWRDNARSRVSGRRFDFPLCCQAHYYLDVLLGRMSGARRGGIEVGPEDAYVPCVLCRARPSRWRTPAVMDGPHGGTLRYTTWEQKCAEYGISAEVARRYVR